MASKVPGFDDYAADEEIVPCIDVELFNGFSALSPKVTKSCWHEGGPKGLRPVAEVKSTSIVIAGGKSLS